MKNWNLHVLLNLFLCTSTACVDGVRPSLDAAPSDTDADVGIPMDLGLDADLNPDVMSGDADVGDAGLDADVGTDVGTPDTTAPTLTRIRPVEGQALDIANGIQLEFSEAIDPTSLTDLTVKVSIAGQSSPVTTTLEGGTVLRIMLNDRPTLPASVELNLSGIRDLASNLADPIRLDWIAPDWIDISGTTSIPRGNTLALAGPERLAIRDSGALLLRTWSEGSWSIPETLTRSSGAALSGPWAAHNAKSAAIAWVELSDDVTTIETRRWAPGLMNAEDLPPLQAKGPVIGIALAIGVDGNIFISWAHPSEGIPPEAYAFESGRWQPVTLPPDVENATTIPAVAVVDGIRWWTAGFGDELRVWQADGLNGWIAKAVFASREPTAVQLSDAGSTMVVAWETKLEEITSVHTARIDSGAITISSAANLSIEAQAKLQHLVPFSEDDGYALIWTEASFEEQRTHLASTTRDRWQALRGIFEDEERTVSPVAASTDIYKRPAIAGWLEDDRFVAYRFNGVSIGEGPSLVGGGAPPKCAPLALDDAANFPQTLADTGCFLDEGKVVAPGIIPYVTTSQLWSDGETKRRWFALPSTSTTVLFNQTPDSPWIFPVGTVLIKEFNVIEGERRRPLETRLYAKRCAVDDPNCLEPWQPYNYQWSEDSTEARLLEGNSEISVEFSVNGAPYVHTYPSRLQCARCHTAAAGWTLGVSIVQLNSRRDYNEASDNQISAMMRAGLLSGVPTGWRPETAVALARHPDPHGGPPQHRAKSYLHANCGGCHRATLRAAHFNFLAPLDTVCPVIVPGSADNSLLFARIRNRGSGLQMPPLATSVVDEIGSGVIREWIDTLNSCP